MKLSQYLSITILSIVTASSAFAQTSSTGALPDGTSVVQVNPEVKDDDKRFSLDLGLEMADPIAKPATGPKENVVYVMIAPSYKINSLLTAAARVIINQDNFGQHETTNSDATLSLGIVGYDITSQLKTLHSVVTVVPANEKSIERDRLKGNIGMVNGVSFTSDYFAVAYRLGLVRNFHEFTQNSDGRPNIEYRVSHGIELKIPLTEKLSFLTSGAYRTGYTYNDFERYAFIFDADVAYEFIKSLTANIGTSNSAEALKSNGVDSNIAAYDEKTSVVRAGLTYSY